MAWAVVASGGELARYGVWAGNVLAMHSMRFSNRDLLLVTLIVALVIEWLIDHRQQFAKQKTDGH